MVKKLINMQTFLEGDDRHTYVGRLLGLITEEEYAGLVSKPELHKKLFSVGTKPLSDIADDSVDVVGMRLVMTITEKDEEAILKPMLFVTNPLDMVSSIVNTDCISMNGRDGAYYIVEEEVTQ